MAGCHVSTPSPAQTRASLLPRWRLCPSPGKGRRGGGWPRKVCNRNCHTHLFLAPPGKPPVLTCRQAHPHSEIISSLGPGISKEALAPTAYSLGWVLALIPRSGAPCQRAPPVRGGADRWVWTVWRTSSRTSWNDPPTELGEGHPYARSVQSMPRSSRVRSFPCLDSAPSCVPESSARPIAAHFTDAPQPLPGSPHP